jgi:hypothetical protein
VPKLASSPAAHALTVSEWIRATWLGWIAGLPLITLFALVGEAFGIGGSQALVGAGMGLGVGISQARALRAILDRTTPWVWACTIGLTLPFLLADILRVAGYRSHYSVQLAVAVGGGVAGIWQAYLLRSRVPRAAWWVAVSAVGWTLAGVAAGSADTLSRATAFHGVAGALIYLGIVACGGLVLGALTGVGLVRLLPVSPMVPTATSPL